MNPKEELTLNLKECNTAATIIYFGHSGHTNTNGSIIFNFVRGYLESVHKAFNKIDIYHMMTALLLLPFRALFHPHNIKGQYYIKIL